MQFSLAGEAKKTWKLSVPIILGELAQMSLHIIDTAMVGALGYKQLAAGALVLAVINIPFVIGIGITISVSQMVSLANGRNDHQKVSHYLYNGFWLCAIAAMLIVGSLHFGRSILFHLKQDPEVAAMAVPFLELINLSIVPMILFMTLKQFADGLEKTKTAMLISLLALPVNIGLNWLLIYGNWGFPRMELRGAGLATLTTRVLMFIAMLWVVIRHHTFRKYIVVAKRQWVLKWRTIKELLHIGLPSSLQIGMESGAFAVSGIIIGTIGATAQAAHQIALSCASFTFMISMGLAQGASIRVSNAFGTRNRTKIQAIGNSTLITGLIYGTFCCLLFITSRNILPHGFNKDADVVSLAAYLLLFAAVFQISDSTQAICAALLRGIKDVKIPTLLIAIAYWVVGIPFGCLLTFHFNMGASGIWIGFIVGLTCSSILLNYRFRKMSKKV